MSELLPYTRQELSGVLDVYDRIEDCIAGEYAVKLQRTKYLPMPNPTDTSTANQWRYTHYLERASFFNATGRTLQGLLGTLFLREPTIKLPTGLQVLAEARNGVELGLAQLARRAAQYTLGLGRSGIFVDYPSSNEPISRANLVQSNTPLLRVYNPRDILNWRVVRRNGVKILSMAVLHEVIDRQDITYSVVDPIETINAYRVLKLEDGVFTVDYWEEGSDEVITYIPSDFDGKVFNTIPFTFIGAENNDEEVDLPPMEAIANINIAHYRNSADYEESCFYTGQPTVYFTGLTHDWIETVFNSAPIPLGARHVVPLPTDAAAGLIQAEPNTMPYEAMQHKERLMMALGARLIEQRTVQRTATEASLDGIADTSILGTVANNVSAAITTALNFACAYAGANTGEVEFKINTNLGYVTMSSDERRELVSEWQSNVISFSELRTNLRQSGVAYEDDKIVLAEAEQKQANELKKAEANAEIVARYASKVPTV